MPTENRSSSTEMVSFPRELSDDLAELIATQARVCGGGAYEIWEVICKGFGQPAERHQGEPVAVLYANGSVLTKADCGDVFDICCKVETPLYTHADPGEVERLRAEIQSLRKTLPNSTTELVDLRAQLAERDALLRETRKFLDWPRHPLPEKIDAALSASADPSALIADPCRWSDQQVMDFLGVALRNVDLQGEVRLSEIRQGFQFMRDRGAL